MDIITKHLNQLLRGDSFSMEDAINTKIPEVLIEAIKRVKDGTELYQILMQTITSDVIDDIILKYSDTHKKRFDVFLLLSTPNLTGPQLTSILAKVTTESLEYFISVNLGTLPVILDRYMVKFLNKLLTLKDFNWKELSFDKNTSLFLGLILNGLNPEDPVSINFVKNRLSDISNQMSFSLSEHSSKNKTKFSHFTDLVYFLSIYKIYKLDLEDGFHNSRLYELK